MLTLLFLLACSQEKTEAVKPIYSTGDCSEAPRLEYPGLSLWQFEVCYVEEAEGVCFQELPERSGAEILYHCDSGLVESWSLIEIPIL